MAVGWSLLTIGALALSSPLDLLDHRPGGATFEIWQRPIFMAMFAFGVLLALRWEIVGGTIAAFTAAGLVVFATQQLRAGPALAVVVAFAVPAILWIVIDLNDQRPAMALLGLIVTIGAVLIGMIVADRIYDRVFGPSHPGSSTVAAQGAAVEWVWSGAVTSQTFTVSAKLDEHATSARLAVGLTAEAVGLTTGEVVRPDLDGVISVQAVGLEPDTRYFYALEVDGTVDRIRTGTVRTFPTSPASFTVAIGSDARVGSNGAVFDAIREIDPLLYVIVGDWHYADIEDPDPELFDEIYDLTLTRPAQAALYSSVPVAYVWDDHDFGGNGSDSTSTVGPVAHEAFRSHVPHYPLAGAEQPLYQAFTIGRARFILTDGRSARTPSAAIDGPGKTMLGTAQKAWLKRELLAAHEQHQLIVWVNPLPWIVEPSEGADHWGGYDTERREIAGFISANDIDGLVMVSGDAHMLAIDDGTNSGYGAGSSPGFPVFHAAALDRPGEVKGGPYSEGAVPGGGQFGTITVVDGGGETVSVTMTGANWRGEELLTKTFTVETPS